MPESTIAEKIIKLRYINNLEREELAKILNLHIDTLEDWELQNIMPKPENIQKLSDYFDKPLQYFHEYYTIYFNNPNEKIRGWMNKNKYNYNDCLNLLHISHSGISRLLSGKINLSYETYLKLRLLGAF